MRARNIKPSLFKNEVLGVADPLLTILFEGLWCEADRDGRLEDRPLRLRAEILPYRHDADVDQMLSWLDEHNFICRYSVGGKRVIQILKFSEHQRPHANEVDSVLPPMEESASTQGQTQAQPNTQVLATKDTSTSLLMLDADSPSLIPDPLIHDARKSTTKVASPVPRETNAEAFEHIAVLQAKYPKAARADWIGAEKYARQLVADGEATWDQLEEAVGRYQRCCRARNREAMNPANFFSARDKPWSQEWPLPATKADSRLASNIEVLNEFVGAA